MTIRRMAQSLSALHALLLIALFLAFCGAARGQDQKQVPLPQTRHRDDNAEAGTLMLVREWDPKARELTGWLPVHHAAMTLNAMPGQQISPFDLNDAVTLIWYRHEPARQSLAGGPQASGLTGEVPVTPQARTSDEICSEGITKQQWAPVEREANVVRIGKIRFFIRAIIFGDSKYRSPTVVQAGRAPYGATAGKNE